MIREIKLSFAYVEEVFESNEECVHFLMLMHAEFQEAVDRISLSIQSQDVYTLRKTLHNVGAHLEMLRASEVQQMLQNIKDRLSDQQLCEAEKRQMIAKVEQYFNRLLVYISERIRQKQTAL
jgi:hypothetical protein